MPTRRPRELPALPFPFAAEGSEVTANAVILEEVPGAANRVLQELLHEARSWVQSPLARKRRRSRAAEVSALPVDVRRPVERIFELLREEPGEQTHQAIGLGLLLVAEWAEAAGTFRTAVVFYQAALTVIPGNVPMTYHVGRLLRRLAMYGEAEDWLRHSAAKASAAHSWENQALALSGLGNLKRERGNFPEAARFHRLTLRSSRRHGVRRLEGDALYDLAVMYFERGELKAGMRYAREAISAYGPGHSQLVRMANDLAWIWMHLHGQARLALQMFQDIEPRVQDPPFRAVLLANIARAAAEIGAAHIYELAWLEAYAYMRKQDTDDGHAAAFAQLALASIAAEQWERARQAATICLAIAERRGEGRSIIMAEQILNAADQAVPERGRMTELFPSSKLAERTVSARQRERNEDFAARVGGAIRARRDDAPESPVRALVRGN